MSIKKRGDTWHIDIVAPDGSRVRRSTGTSEKRKAQEYHDKLKHELWEVSRLNKKPERLFQEGVILFLKDGLGQSNYNYKQLKAEYFLSYFKDRALSSISGEEILLSLPKVNMLNGKLVSNATRNRYRSDIIRIFSLSHKMGWIDSVPFVPTEKEPKVRVRWITKEKAALLLKNIKIDWLYNVCFFALSTGARQNEILSLTWHNVDFVNKLATVTAENAKSGRARSLPLNQSAIDLLRGLRFKSSDGYVFTRKNGKRVSKIDHRLFQLAVKESEINDFRFHDLRHTWASWHVQAGTPLYTLKTMGGWESLEMVNKYAHLNAEHMIEYSNNVTFTAQSAGVSQIFKEVISY
ncbi:site-specific integrase [Orbus sturtevantii]|uniref:tyrosine-type recombinase/integrase n=1 Tax=Orbus sturtevantii TaxID=3074109 RepID=UPI00370CFD5B